VSTPAYEKYKESGVEWLGQVPEHWEIIQSRRLFAQRKQKASETDQQLTASQKHGVIYQKDFMALEGQKVVQVISGADILNHVEPNDFVISMRSFQGGIEWCGLSGSISSAYVMLIPSAEVDAQFFRYLFKSSPYIQALQSTSNLVRDGQALRYNNFALVSLPVIPLAEQRAIASYLDRETARLDTLISRQERLIELSQEKRRALIGHAVTRGLDETAPRKEAGVEWLGEVPAHWEVRKLKGTCFFQEGPGLRHWQFTDEGVRVICVTNITESGIDFSQYEKFISVEEFQKTYQHFKVDRGDLLVSSSGNSWGKVAEFKSDEAVMLNTSTIRVNENEEKKLAKDFLKWVLQSSYVREQLYLLMTGSCQPNFGPSHLGITQVAIPPLSEQRSIEKYLDAETAKIDTLLEKARRAIELMKERRSALIAAAVTGQIDVRGL
jgi:type I restriction enzyme S subunit